MVGPGNVKQVSGRNSQRHLGQRDWILSLRGRGPRRSQSMFPVLLIIARNLRLVDTSLHSLPPLSCVSLYPEFLDVT